ncbi:hypothetical protein [Anatilimnocola aggregata]|uniref:hypothetical protein n=1 Tax=Anatilimnocola aggregata TaxID=2528021 RepID=UPI0011A5DF73|nr:hypothetical protein [Anatilimnocola aggregata]
MDQNELIAQITKVASKHQAAGTICYLNYDEVAAPAIRRWASSNRRGVPQNNLELRIRDLAKALTLPEKSGRRTVHKSTLELAAAIAACMPDYSVALPP